MTTTQMPTAPDPQGRANPGSSRFLGWRMVVIAIVAGSLTGPGQTVGVSVFINSFIADLGLSRDQVSLAYLIGTLAGATAMPAVGQFVDRRGVRTAMLAVSALFGVALFNMSLVQNWIWLVLGFVFIRMLGQGSLSMISTITVAVWFDRLRGRAMGIVGIGVSAGIALTPIAMNALINRFGWRQAWVIAAVVVPAVLVPLAWFALVSRPAHVGQLPDGDTAPDDRDTPTGVVWGYSRGEAMLHPAFWLIVSVTTLTSMLVTGLNFHAIDLLVQNGLTEDEAARMFLPQIIGASATGLGLGWVVDRTSGRFLPALSMALLGTSHLLASFLDSTLLVVVYALSLGVTAGGARVVSGTLVPKWFGTAHVGSINGVLTLMGVAGSALGPITLSLTKGWLGSYAQAALLLACLPILAAALALMVRPPSQPRTSIV